MKKEFLLLMLAFIASIGKTFAEEKSYTGVLVITPDETTTYALSETPQICYKQSGSTTLAQLYIHSKTDPVVEVYIENGKILKAEWGTYMSDIKAITKDKTSTYQKNGRKYITGGKLIIIDKNGTKYNINGTKIN